MPLRNFDLVEGSVENAFLKRAQTPEPARHSGWKGEDIRANRTVRNQYREEP